LTLLISTTVTAWQAVVASRERDKAEKRFDQVRKLAHSVLFEYHDGVAKLAGSTKLREKMIKDAIEYLDNLAADNNNDPLLQNELATAYEKVGDVQGNPYLANLGDQTGALASYQKALAIREAMQGSDPDNSRIRYDVATDHEMIGDIFWAKGENPAAEENYNIAFVTYDLLARDSTAPDVRALGRIYARLGQIQNQDGDFDKAIVSYESSLKEAQALMAVDPTNVDNRRGVAVAFAKIGDILFEQDKYRESAGRFQSSLSIFRELSDADPTDVNLRRPIGLILARLALAEMKVSDYSSAIQHDREAVTIQKGIAAADPDNVQIRNDLTATLANLGETYGLQGNLIAAGEYFREAIAIASDSLSKNSDFAQARKNSGGIYQLYARILLKNGQSVAALTNYRRARELLESSLPVENSLEDLAEVYEGLADAIKSVSKDTGANGEIRDLYKKSLDALQQLETKHTLSNENAERISSVRTKLIKFDEMTAKSTR
jgi:tetratricopeptide (TPR) repeat protein